MIRVRCGVPFCTNTFVSREEDEQKAIADAKLNQWREPTNGVRLICPNHCDVCDDKREAHSVCRRVRYECRENSSQ